MNAGIHVHVWVEYVLVYPENMRALGLQFSGCYCYGMQSFLFGYIRTAFVLATLDLNVLGRNNLFNLLSLISMQ